MSFMEHLQKDPLKQEEIKQILNDIDSFVQQVLKESKHREMCLDYAIVDLSEII